MGLDPIKPQELNLGAGKSANDFNAASYSYTP